jgi:hypothetical protein
MYELYYPEQPTITFVNKELRNLESLPATHFIEALEVEDAELLGEVGKKAVVTRKHFGKGEIIYIGTYVGNSYNYETSPQLQEFIKSIILRADVIPTIQATSGCFVRLAKNREDAIIFLINPRKKIVETQLKSPIITGNLIDLFTNKEIGRFDSTINKDKSINITLGSEESKILLLKHI